jgi:hypothetical protein
MLATIRAAPPQWRQVLTSTPNTRLRHCAHLVERRFVGWAVVVVRFGLSRGFIDGSPSAAHMKSPANDRFSYLAMHLNDSCGSTSAGDVLAGCGQLDCRRWAVLLAKPVSWSGKRWS